MDSWTEPVGEYLMGFGIQEETMMRETQMGMETTVSLLDSNSVLFFFREVKLRYATKWQVYRLTELVSALLRGIKDEFEG